MGKILEFITKHRENEQVSFHMPGHKGGAAFLRADMDEYIDFDMGMDITEVEGADNLHAPKTIIKELMDGYATLYGARKSLLSVGGSTAGILGSMLYSKMISDEIIISRHAHKSAFSGISIAGLRPVYVQPQYIEKNTIAGSVLPEDIDKALEDNPNAKTVFITSPNYYGICSDIAAISKICHEKGAILIVDQAHGAHLKFFGEGELSAEKQGADVVINSIHKTLASPTQTAIVNIMTDRVDERLLEDRILMVQSTSPSYLLLAGLDRNLELMKKLGPAMMMEWQDNLKYFRKALLWIKGVAIADGELMDQSKVNLDLSFLGLDGKALAGLLEKAGIYGEMASGNILTLMTGIGNKRRDYDLVLGAIEKLSDALIDEAIQEEHKRQEESSEENNLLTPMDFFKDVWERKPEKIEGCFKHDFVAVPQKVKYVQIEKAVGLVAATSVCPYPPGVPAICPGEKISKDSVDYIVKLLEEGREVIGVTSDNLVLVGK